MDAYEASGFGARPVGFGKRPGIIVVDFQAAHIDPQYPMGGKKLVLRALENTITLLKQARPMGIPVAVCLTSFSKAIGDAGYWKVAGNHDLYDHKAPIVQLDPRIYDEDHDLIVSKAGPSIFHETRVTSYFTMKCVDTVIVTGVNTSGCIRASINDSFQRGFRTIVPEECVGDVEEGPHKDNLRDVHRRYADVVTLADVQEYLRKIASSRSAA